MLQHYFYNNFINKKYGFNHETKFTYIYNDNFKAFGSTIHYINGTWEKYEFQTSQKAAVLKAINSIESEYTQLLKQVNAWKKITKKRKEEIKKELLKNNEYIELISILESL